MLVLVLALALALVPLAKMEDEREAGDDAGGRGHGREKIDFILSDKVDSQHLQ